MTLMSGVNPGIPWGWHWGWVVAGHGRMANVILSISEAYTKFRVKYSYKNGLTFESFLMQTFPVFATLACWQWQKKWVLLCGGVVPPSKRSYASKVHRLDLYLAFFTASKTSKTADCAWEMSLEKEKAQWVSFFHQNFLGNERQVSRGRDSQFV